MSFEQHSKVVRVPRQIETQPVQVNRSLLSGNREQIDAFADELVAREAELNAQAQQKADDYYDRKARLSHYGR